MATFDLLSALVLLTSLAMLGQSRLLPNIRTVAAQGAVLALLCARLGQLTGERHFYLVAAATLAVKTGVIPWVLGTIVRRLAIGQRIESFTGPGPSLLGGVLLTVVAHYAAGTLRALPSTLSPTAVTLSLATFLCGMLLMLTRKRAVSQVLGFMVMENGIFLLALAETLGMPLVIEMAVLFDLLVGTLTMGLLIHQIRRTFDHLDVSRLSELRG